MILLMDIGNTNIKIGLANDKKTEFTWRVATDYNRTADEIGVVLLNLLQRNGYSFNDVEGVIVSSVAPQVNYTIDHMCSYYMKKKPIMVSAKLNLGNLSLDYTKSEIGADRIVNAVAAYKQYGGPCIVVDFGTATTFGAIDSNGVFEGGLIAPGIKASTESLVNTAAKLPRIELTKPQDVLGKNTVENMQSGIIYGFTGLVEYIINKIKENPKYANAKVIATGGMSQLVTENSNIIDVVDRALSLKGLHILYDLNHK